MNKSIYLFVNLVCSLLLLPSVAFSFDKFGEIAVNGEVIPEYRFKLDNIKRTFDAEEKCSAEAIKEAVIDQWVLHKYVEGEDGVLKNRLLTKLNPTQQDLFDEYRRRVRTQDPKITNVVVIRVKKIPQPKTNVSIFKPEVVSKEWKKKIKAAAQLLKDGVPFDDVAAQYPVPSANPYAENYWITPDSLRENLGKDDVVVGKVLRIDRILEKEYFDRPIVQIVEVKTLLQVRLSDVINAEGRMVVPYLLVYLMEKARERIFHNLVSQRWKEFDITEDGEPIQRVGVYKPCDTRY